MRRISCKAEVIAIYWFIIIGIVLVSLVVTVMANNQMKVDMRNVEAKVLADKLIRCLMPQGSYFDERVFDKNLDSVKFLDLCGLKFSEPDKSEYYFMIKFYNIDSCADADVKDANGVVSKYAGTCDENGLIRQTISFGPKTIGTEGVFTEMSPDAGLSLARGTRTNLYGIRKSDGKKIIVHIITAVSKVKENVMYT